MTGPLVSVVMTAYRRERFIGDAIASVVAQTLTDWELIIVDDASGDGTVGVAEAWAARDARIRVQVNATNLGDYPNRNFAASLARGTYLRFHDSDDVLYPHALATMVAGLAAYPAAGFGLSTGYGWPGGPVPMFLTPRQAFQREYLGHGLFNCGPSCALFRREVFESLGRFPLVGVSSDFAFWTTACRTVPVVLLPGDLFWYRIHEGQELTNPANARHSALAMRYAWEALAAPDCPLTPDEREQARRNWAWAVGRVIREDLLRGELALAWTRLTRIGLRPADWVRYFRRGRRSATAGVALDADGDPIVPSWSAP